MVEGFLILLFLSFSFLFSGSEAAFFSLTPLHLSRLHGGREERNILFLLKTPYRLLSTILLGNTTTNVLGASLFTLLTIRFLPQLEEPLRSILGMILFATLLLFVAELTPKILAFKSPLRFARYSTRILYPVYFLLSPFSYPLSLFLRKVVGKGRRGVKEMALLEELSEILARAREEASLKEEDAILFEDSLRFLNSTVKTIIQPRRDIKALPAKSTLADAIDLSRATGYSRFPVYRENLDQVVGILEVVDCIRKNFSGETKIETLLKPSLFIFENMRLHEFFLRLKGSGRKMAIVVDEYGGTLGLLTLHDVRKRLISRVEET